VWGKGQRFVFIYRSYRYICALVWELTVGLILSMGSAADTALTKAGPPATPGKSFWIGAPAYTHGNRPSICD